MLQGCFEWYIKGRKTNDFVIIKGSLLWCELDRCVLYPI